MDIPALRRASQLHIAKLTRDASLPPCLPENVDVTSVEGTDLLSIANIFEESSYTDTSSTVSKRLLQKHDSMIDVCRSMARFLY